MTTTGKVFAFATAALYLIAVVNDRELSYLMCWATLSVLIASALLSRLSLSGVEVTLQDCPSRGFEGRSVPVALRFRNRGSLNKTNLVLRLSVANETQGSAADTQWHLPCLEAGEEVDEVLLLRDLRRGVVSIGSARLTAGDPLGLFRCRRPVPLSHQLVVYPRRVALPEAALFGAGRGDRSAVRESPTGSGDSEFHAVRQFVDGDDLRRVHWPTTARTGRLAIKEFEGAARLEAVLLVDLWREQTDRPGGLEAFEDSLRVAASLAQGVLKRGGVLRVHLSSDRAVHLPPDRGERQLVRLLEALARARADGPLPLDRVLLDLLRTLPQAGVVACVSSALPAGLPRAATALRARQVGLSVAHVPPAAQDPTQSSGPEAEITRALRGLGVTVQPVGLEHPSLPTDGDGAAESAWDAWPARRAARSLTT